MSDRPNTASAACIDQAYQRLKDWSVTEPHAVATGLLNRAIELIDSSDAAVDETVVWIRSALADHDRSSDELSFFDDAWRTDTDYPALMELLDESDDLWWMTASARALPIATLSHVLSAHLREIRQPGSGLIAEARTELTSALAQSESLRDELLSRVDAAFENVDRSTEAPGRLKTWSARRREAAVRKEQRKAEAGWSSYVEKCANVGVLHHAVMKLLADLDRIRKAAVDEVIAVVEEQIERPIERAIRDYEVAAERVKDTVQGAADLEDLAERIEAVESDLAGKVSSGPIASLRKLSVSPSRAVAAALKSVTFAKLAEHCEVFAEREDQWSTTRPPRLDDLDVPVRSLAESYVEGDLRRGVDAYTESMSRLIDGALKRSEAVRRAVTFSLESAIAELDERSESPTDGEDDATAIRTASEFLSGGIDRGAARLKENLDAVRTEKVALSEAVESGIDSVRTAILEDFAPDQGIELRLRLLRRQARVTAGGVVVSGNTWTSRLGGRLRGGFDRVRRFSQSSVARLPWIDHPAEQEIEASIDEADRFESVVEGLPTIYRRLFRLQPLEVDDFLVGRDEEFGILTRALARFRAKKPANVAVVGETGSGKSSFLNCAARLHFTGMPLVRIAFEKTMTSESELASCIGEAAGFPGVTSIGNLEERLLEVEDPMVITLEAGHQLFLRRVGGFEAIRALLLLVTRTNHKVFWVMSVAEYAWVYLNRVVNISDYFPYLIETRNMSGEDIESAVMTRNEASGFALRFLEAPDLPKRVRKALRSASGEQDKQDVLRRRYFEDLQRASRGNVQIALYLWVRSIRPRGDVLDVEPVPDLTFAFVGRLPLPKLTALAAILQHGSLTPAEHARIFGSPEPASILLFEALEGQSLIRTVTPSATRSSHTPYMVAEVLRRSVVEQLRSRNLFH